MVTKESEGSNFDLPEEVLRVLPSDPYEQLELARKITSIVLSTRVSLLESESTSLRAKIAEKDTLIADLQSHIESLKASLSDTADKLSLAYQDKENLVRENSSLTSTVKKLQRDVSNLEVLRKTLMQSLQEVEENSAGAQQIIAKPTPSEDDRDDAALMASRSSSTCSQFSEMGNLIAAEHESDASRSSTGNGIFCGSSSAVASTGDSIFGGSSAAIASNGSSIFGGSFAAIKSTAGSTFGGSSLEFSSTGSGTFGGSFSLGTCGDKSNRRTVKVSRINQKK